MQGTLRIANTIRQLKYDKIVNGSFHCYFKNIIGLTIPGGENINEREKIFVF